jgi:hypothetical protein
LQKLGSQKLKQQGEQLESELLGPEKKLGTWKKNQARGKIQSKIEG